MSSKHAVALLVLATACAQTPTTQDLLTGEQLVLQLRVDRGVQATLAAMRDAGCPFELTVDGGTAVELRPDFGFAGVYVRQGACGGAGGRTGKLVIPLGRDAEVLAVSAQTAVLDSGEPVDYAGFIVDANGALTTFSDLARYEGAWTETLRVAYEAAFPAVTQAPASARVVSDGEAATSCPRSATTQATAEGEAGTECTSAPPRAGADSSAESLSCGQCVAWKATTRNVLAGICTAALGVVTAAGAVVTFGNGVSTVVALSAGQLELAVVPGIITVVAAAITLGSGIGTVACAHHLGAAGPADRNACGDPPCTPAECTPPATRAVTIDGVDATQICATSGDDAFTWVSPP